jgi:DNA repair protein RecO (recombination protein O)
MALKESEAIVLRSWELREADLLVSFFTRAEGKVKGVAKSAKKSKKRFGGALEPLTWVRVYYADKEGRELAHIDSCEVLESPLASAVDVPRAMALGHVAEVLDELLPEREANDALFRLALAVVRRLNAGEIWAPLTYFDLWIARLTGILPEMTECMACGTALDGHKAFFHVLADGLMCARHKRLASSEMSGESRQLAAEMFRSPVESFAAWPKAKAADLRKFAVQAIERHIEKKLVTAGMLERLNTY